MNSVVNDVIVFCRMFAMFEREEVCCGTVTPAQCVLLQTLRTGQWDISSLAAHSRVTKGAMTRLVDGLQTRGWVRREQSPDDGRRFIVSLTASGDKESARLMELTEESINMLLERIPKNERSQVVHSVHLLREAAEQMRSALTCC